MTAQLHLPSPPTHFVRTTLSRVLVLLLALLFLCPAASFADADESLTEYHDYFIPWVAGETTCRGAYRILATSGTYDAEAVTSRISVAGKDAAGVPRTAVSLMGTWADERRLQRDDVILLTDFNVKYQHRTTEIRSGRVIEVIRTYHHETPYAVAGYSLDMDPYFGSDAISEFGRPLYILLDRSVMGRYVPGFNPRYLIPSLRDYRNPTTTPPAPSGKVVSTRRVAPNRYAHILSLQDSGRNPSFIGWWRPFSPDRLNSLYEELRSTSLPATKFSSDSLWRNLFGGGTSPAVLPTSGVEMVPEFFDEYLYVTGRAVTARPVRGGVFQGGKLPVPGMTAAMKLWDARADAILRQAKPAADRIAAANSSVRPRNLPVIRTDAGDFRDRFVAGPGFSYTSAKPDVLEGILLSFHRVEPDWMVRYPYHLAAAKGRTEGVVRLPVLSGTGTSLESAISFLGDADADMDRFRDLFFRSVSTKISPIVRSFTTVLPAGSRSDLSPAVDPFTPVWFPGASGALKARDPWVAMRSVDETLWRTGVQGISLEMAQTFITAPAGLTGWSHSGSMVRTTPPLLTGTWSGAYRKDRLEPDGSEWQRLMDATPLKTKAAELFFGAQSAQGHAAGLSAKKLVVRYFPFRVDGVEWMTRNFPGFGTAVGVPDWSLHRQVWNWFPMTYEGFAGNPPEWK